MRAHTLCFVCLFDTVIQSERTMKSVFLVISYAVSGYCIYSPVEGSPRSIFFASSDGEAKRLVVALHLDISSVS